MDKLKKHIAILLFGVFFFPMVYQPAHTVLHHRSMGSHEQYFHEQADANNLGFTFNEVDSSDEPCPICSYQFSINDVPQIYIYRTIHPICSNVLVIAGEKLYGQQLIFVSPARAPPSC